MLLFRCGAVRPEAHRSPPWAAWLGRLGRLGARGVVRSGPAARFPWQAARPRRQACQRRPAAMRYALAWPGLAGPVVPLPTPTPPHVMPLYRERNVPADFLSSARRLGHRQTGRGMAWRRVASRSASRAVATSRCPRRLGGAQSPTLSRSEPRRSSARRPSRRPEAATTCRANCTAARPPPSPHGAPWGLPSSK